MAIDQEIRLSATGGDASAAEIAKTSKALDGVSGVSKGMEEQFSHRFTHIGLQMFAGDLLRSSGLGREARQIIGVLQTGVMGASAAFGAAAGPIMLVVSGLTALVGIASTVIEKHKAEAEGLKKLAEEQTKAHEGYESEILALQRMQTAGVALTTSQQHLLTADKAVAEDIKTNLLTTQEKEIAALIKQRDEIQLHQQMHLQWAAAMVVAKAGLESIWDVTKKMLDPLVRLTAGIQAMSAHFASLASGTQQHVTLTGTFKQKYDELTAAIARARVVHAATAAGITSDIQKMSEEAVKARQQRVANEVAMYNEMQTIRATDMNRDRQQMDNRLEHWIETKQAEIDAQEKASEKIQKTAKKYADMMGQDLGSALGKSLIEGKNFTQEMNQAFTRMAEQFIEKIIMMIIEWLALKAVMDIFPGGDEAYQGTANAAYPAVANAAYKGMDFGGMMAAGGSRLVNKPTLFMAGEAGPEIAQFTPVGANGGSGGGGSSIGAVNINLNVDKIDGNDPAGTLQMLADQIRRETSAGRVFAATVAGVANRYPNQAY